MDTNGGDSPPHQHPSTPVEDTAPQPQVGSQISRPLLPRCIRCAGCVGDSGLSKHLSVEYGMDVQNWIEHHMPLRDMDWPCLTMFLSPPHHLTYGGLRTYSPSSTFYPIHDWVSEHARHRAIEAARHLHSSRVLPFWTWKRTSQLGTNSLVDAWPHPGAVRKWLGKCSAATATPT